jgi:hypothetical protein
MSLLVELLEFAGGIVRSWRMAVALAVTALLVWLIVEYGPRNAGGTVIAFGFAIAGIVIGWRWARAAEAG